VREAVGVFDQSSFAKFLVQGRDAERVLNRLSTADVAVAPGRATYTQFLNARGGIEADLTITRLDQDRYFLVVPAFTATHVDAWIKEHIPAGALCVITDVTGAWCMLNVQGPRSRDLLASLSRADFSAEAFPFGTLQRIEIGYQHALALRISYTGELGWELYVPTEMAQLAYDALIAKGAQFGLRHCGYHALNSLRMEKAFRDWAHDMGPRDTPLEAGLGFTCAWNKPNGFIGQEALQQARTAGPPRRRLVQFLLEDAEPVLHHNEPILRNGVRVGYTTSAAYAHTLGASAALGYVACDDGVTAEFIRGGSYQIEQADRIYTARASLTPMYDPEARRMRG
jgi:glycine cleavage system aminomethyltransferase T